MQTNIEIEEILCPVCGELEKIPFHREGSFQMVRCLSCQFIYLNPRPTNSSLSHFYQHYLPDQASSIKSWQRMMEPIFKRAASLIENYKTCGAGREKGRLLDVGAGFGFFLAEMKKRGWEVKGVEISKRGMDYARDVLGIRIDPGPLEKVGFVDENFDVVTGFYVIEHLSVPIDFLRECYRVLKPGGLLLLRYPHTTPIKNLLLLFGIENRLYDLPAHLSDFSPEIIQRCLEGIGFEKCHHLIGGYTRPWDWKKWIASFLFGNLSEILFYLSLKKFLFPGVSKTVLAFKREG